MQTTTRTTTTTTTIKERRKENKREKQATESLDFRSTGRTRELKKDIARREREKDRARVSEGEIEGVINE